MKKTAEKKTRVEAKKASGEKKFLDVTLADIGPNPNNPRKNYSGPKFDELMASIKQVGVIEPILLRPVKGKIPYEIIAGERRWRASCEIAGGNGGLKKSSIPAIVREIGDDEAFDLMTIENLQREDLTELEEAQSFKIYLDKKGMGCLPELAERTGINPSYIRRRVRVLSLPKEVLTAWDQGKLLYGHCEQLARMTDKKEIKEAVNEIIEQSKYSPVTVKDLREQINRQAIALSAAKFDIEKAGCAKCQHNSDVQKKLFDEDIEKSLCTDTKCFKQNQNNWLMANWKKEFKKIGTNGFRFREDVRGESNNFSTPHNNPGAKCKECQFFVSIIEVSGEKHYPLACVGDKSCYNQIIAAGKKQAEKKTAAASADKSGAGSQEETLEETSVDTPRVTWPGGFFIEEFYKTAIPGRFEKIAAEHDIAQHYQPGTIDKILRFSLISLLIANSNLRMKFAKRWMIDKFTLKKDEEDGEEYLVDKDGDDISEHQITQEDIWDKLTLMSMMDLLKAHEVAAGEAIMQHNQTRADIRHAVALHLGIDLAKEWRITKEYLDKKTTKECLVLIDDLKISTDEKALTYLHETLNKKRGKFNTCKKAELISLIMESGVDLAGKVPAEILNAAKKMETPEEDND